MAASMPPCATPSWAPCKCGASIVTSPNALDPFISWDDQSWAMDAWVPGVARIILTHAHLDHVPTTFQHGEQQSPLGSKSTPMILTSLPTRSLLAARGIMLPPGPSLIFGETSSPTPFQGSSLQVTSIASGHMEGAASLYFRHQETGTSLFYAGEFYPVVHGILPGLDPRNTTTLICESTYGHPDWDHPPPGVAERQLRDAVADFAKQGPVMVAGYAGGKMARIVEILAGLALPFIVSPEFAREWAVLQEMKEWQSLDQSDPPITIYTRSQLRGSKGKEIRRRAVYLVQPRDLLSMKNQEDLANAPSVLCGGRVLDPQYRAEHPATTYVPLRDHPTYIELLNFVKACHPEEVFVLPGQELSLCWAIRHELGIECNPFRTPHPSGLPNLPFLFSG